MSNGRKSLHVADHHMINGEGSSTPASLGYIFEFPVISQADGIVELTLVQRKP